MSDKKPTIKQEYEALVGLCNDLTGKRYKAGAIVTEDDFPAAVIKDWLRIDPPVLRPVAKKEGA